MESRGIWHLMSARTRRSLTLTWIVLFALSLLLQSFSLAGAQPVLAVHDEQFQLDGNAIDDPGTPPDDWANHPGADAFSLVNDPLDGSVDNIFTTGGSKDVNDTNEWRWTLGNVPDKDNLEHAFAALYGDNIYFGADRFANDGDAAVGFWFFKNGITVNANGTFSPIHAVGDLFVVSHFENGGTASDIVLYQWTGSVLQELGSGAVCTAPPVDDMACAIANASATPAPWPYTPKSGPANIYPANSFFEGGLDLAALYGGNPPCFSSFLVETRSSQEPNAQLKDFAFGSFNTCVPPTITTAVSSANVDFGGTVTDTATLSGSDGPASGTVSFFLCGPAASNPDCSTGGTQVGGAVAVSTTASGGTATSAAFTVGTTAAAVGNYCFRAVYTPDAASQYLAGSHTNTTTECFNVAAPVVTLGLQVTKAVTGNTGGTDPILNVPLAQIGDTLHYTLTYSGVGPITNAVITDVLPVGLDYKVGSAAGDANFTFVDYNTTTRTLTWTAASLPDPASGSVSYDVTVPAAAADQPQPLVNVATIDSTQTEPDSDTRSVAVLAPPLELTPPPTSTLSPESGTSNPGFGLMLVLLGLAGLALGVGFVTPVPERVRRRDRLG
jgi:uncharacterized repeat protein (TIGR01451 family)